MKAIVLAYHNIGCAGIEALVRHGFQVAAVFTHADDPRENTWFDSAAETASAYEIPVFAPQDINHPMWVQRIRELSPDILFSFYYRKIVKSSILEIPAHGCFNLHGSLLPRYRGRCPINWAIINGETETGVTLHHMTTRADAGDIVRQEKVSIDAQDTAKALNDKLTAASIVMLDKILPMIKEGSAPRFRQDESLASHFGGRKPEDGRIDWTLPAEWIANLVRAVSRPYPGAFSYLGRKKCFFWNATPLPQPGKSPQPGTIVSTNPLEIACGDGMLRIEAGQPEDGIYMTGIQLAGELNLVVGRRFNERMTSSTDSAIKKHILILGVGGFIGNALTERLLDSKRYVVHGMDLNSKSVERFMDYPDFDFLEGDITIQREWIEYQVRKCDTVIPLVAIATPIEYTRNPLRVFELDFEENLRIVRHCVKYGKRVLFPSTSEVYGMCADDEFREDSSRLALGPIRKQRWIYSSCKQLLDRVIWAYGQQKGLAFTLFRPFNWIGPRLDSLSSARIGSSRAITQLILNLVEGTPMLLVDGGSQQRCFTDVSDGIECLYRIIENKNGVCDGQIINIGNPYNEVEIRVLAELLVKEFEKHPLRPFFPPFAGMRTVESRSFYGNGYQDVSHRKPSVQKAERLLQWKPRIGLLESVDKTLDFFLHESLAETEPRYDPAVPSNRSKERLLA
jgi:UDP-4-amino-4-deoxy-L-arabinose formyltransferase/UDP-glucuronic acid dehydrogenase (UDP-4-keto-hexauronic acid decarboxylating)